MSHLLRNDATAALPPALGGLQRPYYLHQTPAWKLRLLLAAASIAVGAGLAAAAWRVSGGRAAPDVWLMTAFLLVFAVPLLRPATWRSPVSMAADVRGLHFLGSDTTQSPVFVPWAQTGPITIERRSGTRTVVVTIDDASEYWAGAKRSRFLREWLGDPDAQGRRRVPLGRLGISADATREALEALRRRAETRGDAPHGRIRGLPAEPAGE